MSEDLRAFMDAMNLPSAVLAGHSMGSMVAQRFAIDHPDRLNGLVLMGAFSTMHGRADMFEYVATVINGLSDPVDAAVAVDFQVSTLAHGIPPALLDVFVRESLKVPARVWQSAFNGFLATPDWLHELAAVTAPSLLVWGDRDSYALRGDQERLLGAIPGARLVTYEGHGHAMHWEDPARFAEDISRFILACPQARVGGARAPRLPDCAWPGTRSAHSCR